jgi:hypothetical protein
MKREKRVTRPLPARAGKSVDILLGTGFPPNTPSRGGPLAPLALGSDQPAGVIANVAKAHRPKNSAGNYQRQHETNEHQNSVIAGKRDGE